MNLEGIVLVDKPAGPTSHDVVAKMRKLFNTRKVGHAGTLDPMATGMLVIGIGRATRLLGYFTAHDKEYLGTIRLGIVTTTDDAQGELVEILDRDVLPGESAPEGALQESWISVEIDRESDASDLATIESRIQRVLDCICS